MSLVLVVYFVAVILLKRLLLMGDSREHFLCFS